MTRDHEVLRAADRRPVPWKNGAGTTTEVAEGGSGDASVPFDWRISIATIDRDADFSVFPGVDRVLMPLSPAGLRLIVDGAPVALAALEPLAFAGEAAVRAVAVTRAGIDLNLMCRRGVVRGTVEVVASGSLHAVAIAAAAAEQVVVIALDDDVAADDAVLGAHDAVVIGRSPVSFPGDGRIAIVRVLP